MTFHEWVEKVAGFLDDWRYQSTGPDRASLVHRTTDAEVTMTLHLSWREEAVGDLEGRGIKTTVWPKLVKEDGSGFHPHSSPLRSGIGITIGRDPKAAAADIKRRLLDPYLVEFEEATRKRQEYVDRRNAAREMASLLAEAVVAQTSDRDPLKFHRRRTPRDYLSLCVDGEVSMGYGSSPTTAKLTLSNLSCAQAKTVLELIKPEIEGVTGKR